MHTRPSWSNFFLRRTSVRSHVHPHPCILRYKIDSEQDGIEFFKLKQITELNRANYSVHLRFFQHIRMEQCMQSDDTNDCHIRLHHHCVAQNKTVTQNCSICDGIPKSNILLLYASSVREGRKFEFLAMGP